MFNKDLPRWILASLSKHFKDVADDLGIKFYSEGVDDPTSKVYQNTNLSLRIDGPTAQEGSSTTIYRIEVQGMVTGIGETPGYLLHTYAGEVAESIRSVIPVYKIPEAPTEEVGCLDLDTNARDGVRIVNLGVVSPSSNVRQLAVVIRLVFEE